MIDSYFDKTLFVLTIAETPILLQLILVPDLKVTKTRLFIATNDTNQSEIRRAIFNKLRPVTVVIVNSLDTLINRLEIRTGDNSKFVLVSIAETQPDWCSNRYYFGPADNFISLLQPNNLERFGSLFP